MLYADLTRATFINKLNGWVLKKARINLLHAAVFYSVYLLSFIQLVELLRELLPPP